MKAKPDLTGFLNVDLELVATFDLGPLVEHLNSAMFTLRDSVDEGRRTVWMELNGDPNDADDAIVQYGALVESLPSDIRELWDKCEDRCMNVGIQSGFAPQTGVFRVSPHAIAKLLDIGARLEITVYGADGKGPNRGSGTASDRSWVDS